MSNEIQDNHPTNSKDNSDCLSKAKKLIYLRKMNKILFYFLKKGANVCICAFFVVTLQRKLLGNESTN